MISFLCIKYWNGFIKNNLSTYIQPSHNIIFGVTAKKLFEMPYRLHISGNFFAYRTVNI